MSSACDGYANIEVKSLLKRIEQYEGIVVLATNLRRNLDEVFVRRLSEVIEFPIPDEAAREQIWRKHCPAAAPTQGIDSASVANAVVRRPAGGRDRLHARDAVADAAGLHGARGATAGPHARAAEADQ
jgi:SpoVK/Ycf46/Vps4 family AAA+-type ATPase